MRRKRPKGMSPSEWALIKANADVTKAIKPAIDYAANVRKAIADFRKEHSKGKASSIEINAKIDERKYKPVFGIMVKDSKYNTLTTY